MSKDTLAKFLSVEAFLFGAYPLLHLSCQRQVTVCNVDVQVVYTDTWDLCLHHNTLIC